MGREYGRALPLATKAAGDAWEVSGYLSTFGGPPDAHGDIILPAAFDATLRSGRKVKFLFAHRDDKPLGPPLDLRVDDRGLFATGRLSKTQLGADVHTWLLDGAVDSWSIGYWPESFEFREDEDGNLTRYLKSIDLLEGSLLPIPANERAVVTDVKSAEVAEPVPAGKPFPNEHSCRILDPGRFQADSFRRISRESDGKRYDVIMGRLKGESTMTTQALRYPKTVWTAAEARAHCRSHDGQSFEPAGDSAGQTGCLCHGDHGLSYVAHAAQVERVLAEFVTRSVQGAEQRQADGRALSAERIAAMACMSGSLAEAHAALDALTQAAQPKSYATEWALLQTRLRLAGVEVGS